MRNPIRTAVLVAGLCGLFIGLAMAAESNVYWRVDLNQGTSIIAYGQGATEQEAWQDCYRLRAITQAMSAAETRKAAVAAVTTSARRWCKNPVQYATVAPDPVVPPPPVRQAMLSWIPPTQNTDGSTLTSLAGYRISYGTSAGALTQAIQVANPGATSYTIANLAPGTYYFSVRAYLVDGVESIGSSVISKTIL